MSLIASDIGVTTSAEIAGNLREAAPNGSRFGWAELKDLLKEQLRAILDENSGPPAKVAAPPAVIMMVGVNAPQTRQRAGSWPPSIARREKQCCFRAADTFRAAAIEQLEIWGETQRRRDDSDEAREPILPRCSSTRYRLPKLVILNAVIVDTAGRLHHQDRFNGGGWNKMRRTAQRIIPDATARGPAGSGRKPLDRTDWQQARLFTESAGVTGIVLTKLDGTAKGGIAVAIAREMKLPVRFGGIRRSARRSAAFDSAAFVNSLLEN